MRVEVIEPNISVVFETQCIISCIAIVRPTFRQISNYIR